MNVAHTSPSWRQPDGSPVSCREKLRVLEDNLAELSEMMRDAFDDAILIGVDEGQMRQVLADMIASLRSPRA